MKNLQLNEFKSTFLYRIVILCLYKGFQTGFYLLRRLNINYHLNIHLAMKGYLK